jgi:hypothetical protein
LSLQSMGAFSRAFSHDKKSAVRKSADSGSQHPAS